MVPRACAMLSLMHQRGEERLRLIVLASVDVGHGRLGAETITLLTLLTLGVLHEASADGFQLEALVDCTSQLMCKSRTQELVV